MPAALKTLAIAKEINPATVTLIAGPHPITPLMVRDTDRTLHLAAALFARGVLATAITYPVVPRGDEAIRFQIAADHTPDDIDEALAALTGALREV